MRWKPQDFIDSRAAGVRYRKGKLEEEAAALKKLTVRTPDQQARLDAIPQLLLDQDAMLRNEVESFYPTC